MSSAPFLHERWRRIEELFHQVVDMPEDQRADILSRACQDTAMRREIEALLATDDQESPRIAGIVDNATNSLLDEED
jgi:hypothetical protein